MLVISTRVQRREAQAKQVLDADQHSIRERWVRLSESFYSAKAHDLSDDVGKVIGLDTPFRPRLPRISPTGRVPRGWTSHSISLGSSGAPHRRTDSRRWPAALPRGQPARYTPRRPRRSLRDSRLRVEERAF